MTDDRARTGRCLCGKVRFSCVLAENDVYACHCSMCRRWGGGPGLSIRAAAAPNIDRIDNIRTFESSEWGSRRFCKICGTHLFFEAPTASYIGISAGALDDLTGLIMTTEIFIDCKTALYDFANPTERLTEAEFLARVASPPAEGGAP